MFSPNIFGQWTNDGSCVVTWNSCNQQIFKIPYTLHVDHFIFQICTFLANFAPLLSLKASWCDRACGRKLVQKCHSIPIPRSQVFFQFFCWKCSSENIERKLCQSLLHHMRCSSLSKNIQFVDSLELWSLLQEETTMLIHLLAADSSSICPNVVVVCL